MTVPSTPVRMLAGLAGLALLVGGCGAAAHLNFLQPPPVRAARAIVLPVDHQPLATSRRLPPFQAGIDIDWCHYPGRSGSVHATMAAPSPAQLAAAIGIFKRAGLYLSLRPVLDEKSLRRRTVGWVPASQRAWFRSYQRFLKPYAQMAGHAGVNEFIAAAKGAQNKPWILNWPVHRTDPQLQARWFTAACQAAVTTDLGGIYFCSIGLTQNNPVGPTLASQTTWAGGPGARAIARCFAAIDRTHR